MTRDTLFQTMGNKNFPFFFSLLLLHSFPQQRKIFGWCRKVLLVMRLAKISLLLFPLLFFYYEWDMGWHGKNLPMLSSPPLLCFNASAIKEKWEFMTQFCKGGRDLSLWLLMLMLLLLLLIMIMISMMMMLQNAYEFFSACITCSIHVQ